jgi:UDP-2,3-diacylglucosamine pyrophosphatase LpxH
MKEWIRSQLRGPVLRWTHRFSSKPDRTRIFAALSDLLSRILNGETGKGLVVPFDIETGKFIIFSDQHKGGKNGADDFAVCEWAYTDALTYYNQNGFHLIALGDCEELWENTLTSVKRSNIASFEKEKDFIPRNAYIKIFGNHDLHWANDPLASFQLKEIYEMEVPIYEGVVLETKIHGERLRIFCTHGHQGDRISDGNWFSKFFIAKIWAPFQSFLKINPNTPAYDASLKTLHNTIMYEWAIQQPNLLFITGHTHQPVFESLTHIERLYRQLLHARQQGNTAIQEQMQQEITLRKFQFAEVSDDYLTMHPCYFNSGCCCFDNGAITGIEIADGNIRLIEWKAIDGVMHRMVLEETPLQELQMALSQK